MIDLATIARRRQQLTAAAPASGPGIPSLGPPQPGMSGGTPMDSGGAPMAGVPAYKKGGRQVISEPSIILGLKSKKVLATIDEFGSRQPETLTISHKGKTLKGKGAKIKGVRPYAGGGDIDVNAAAQAAIGRPLTAEEQDLVNANHDSLAQSLGQQQQADSGPAPSIYTGANAGSSAGLKDPKFMATNPYGPGFNGGATAPAPPPPVFTPTAAQTGQFNAQQNSFQARGTALTAAGDVPAAEAGQTSAQRAFYAEQARAAAQELQLERERQAAQYNTADQESTNYKLKQQEWVDSNRSQLGLTKMRDVLLPPGYSGPALSLWDRPKVETQEQQLARQESDVAATNKFQSELGSAAVGMAGTNVSTAQQASTLAGIAAQRAGLLEDQSKAPPVAGEVFDDLTGTFVPPSEYARSHAYNRYVEDPVNKIQVTHEDLNARTDAHGNVINLKTGEWTDPRTGNVFRGGEWIDPDTGNVFQDGHWVDPQSGQWFVPTSGGVNLGAGQASGEWHRNFNGKEQVLRAGRWVNEKGGGAGGTGLDANGNPVDGSQAPAGNGDSGLTPTQ